ncbi:MAG: hypothetical protein HPY62_07880 [Bacteroidales bacterium]|nr:hypothetical protein [Bacteroidales bacterium]
MKDYEQIISICDRSSEISSSVIDEFLINYAARRNKLELEMNVKFAAYKHITRQFPKEWENRLKAQYIAHNIFKYDGSIKKFLNHTEIKNLGNEALEYLKYQSENPWKFSFSFIKENPYKDFYIMTDVFRGNDFLLFSPGTTRTLESLRAILWFNLISFNGSCWQSFGPIGAYQSFEPDDIFFFATELNSSIEDEEDLLSDVENNPIPYMMLTSGATNPVLASGKDQIVHLLAAYDIEKMDTKSLAESFRTEYNKGVYKLSLKRWISHPHFAQAFYDEEIKILFLSAMTEKGFDALVKKFRLYGYNISPDPFIRVNPSMVATASEILGRKIDLLEYEHLFSKEETPENKEKLGKLNALMDLIMNDFNAGIKPDVESYAKKSGVHIDTVRSLVEQVLNKLGNIGR